jgi:hypothetical protein
LLSFSEIEGDMELQDQVLNNDENSNLSNENFVNFETRGRAIECKKCSGKYKIVNPIEKENWQNNKMPCPHCGELYSPLPDTERQLRCLQDSFFNSNRNEKYITEITKILFSYCRSLILKYFSNKLTHTGQLEYYTTSAVSYFIEEYYAHDTFKIKVSFANYLYGKISQAIFGKQEYKAAPESLDYVLQDGHTVAYEDPTSNFAEKIQNLEDHLYLYNYVTKLIDEMKMFCSSPLENYIRLINVYNFLEDGEKAVDNFFSCYDRLGKYQTLKTLEILKKEIQRSLKNEF